MPKEVFRSRVYTERPAYADFDAPHKFEEIKSTVAKRLIEHSNAILLGIRKEQISFPYLGRNTYLSL